jgi:hypothetical protein
MVEEAAEVLETHVVCSLTADCQQLIMIGKVLIFQITTNKACYWV